MEERSRDQTVYLISKQEERVALSVITATTLSLRLEEFVTSLMKVEEVFKASLRFLLVLKAYPVNCSTHVLQTVTKFCKTKAILDDMNCHEGRLMSTAQERSYWTRFLRHYMNGSASLLQVAEDLEIQSLIEVIHLVYHPICTTLLVPDTVNSEEQRLLLSSSPSTPTSRGQTSPCGQWRDYSARDYSEITMFNDPPSCMSALKRPERAEDFANLILGSTTCHDQELAVRSHARPESQMREEVSNSSTRISGGSVMTLAELMRLETIVSDFEITTAGAEEDVIRLAREFDAWMTGEPDPKQAHRLLFKKCDHRRQSSVKISKHSSLKSILKVTAKKTVRFRRSPEFINPKSIWFEHSDPITTTSDWQTSRPENRISASKAGNAADTHLKKAQIAGHPV